MIMSECKEYMFNIEIEHVTTQVLITLGFLFLYMHEISNVILVQPILLFAVNVF